MLAETKIFWLSQQKSNPEQDLALVVSEIQQQLRRTNSNSPVYVYVGQFVYGLPILPTAPAKQGRENTD